MSTPSLLNVPYRLKAGTLYSQIPETGLGDFAVTRATSPTTNRSTRVNSLGFIELVNDGVPRLDYPLGGAVNGCPALLVEPSAMNLVPDGLGYTALPGVLYDTTVTDSPATSINGARITKDEASGTIRYAGQNFSSIALSANTAYTISQFFKFDGHTFATSLEANNSGQWGSVPWNQSVNLASSGVTLGTSTSCTGSVENYGNGWYRVSVRVTTGATISGSTPVNVLSILPSALSTGQGFLASLPQLETGSIATSYIPTTTAAITRAADVINKTGVSSLIGQTQGTLYAEVDYRNLSTESQAILELFQDSSNRFGFATYRSGSDNLFQFYCLVSNSVTVNINTIRTAGIYKLAGAYANNNWVFYINGTQIGTNTSSAVPTASTIQLGSSDAGTLQFNNRIRASALYPNRLSNTELATLTTP